MDDLGHAVCYALAAKKSRVKKSLMNGKVVTFADQVAGAVWSEYLKVSKF